MAELCDAPWLTAGSLQRVFEAIEQDGDEARAVGGSVRNTLLGVPVSDVDIATTATPETTAARAEAAGLKAIPTGLEHGTITIVSAGVPYEVTTLREDVETFGRHAVVKFGRDWRRDAERRDFTMNALYSDRNGQIHDPLGGLEDCLEGRVRFIGSATERIREDYLRILRFFRILAAYGKGVPDPEGLSACLQERDGLRQLSAERIGMEMRRLVVAPRAGEIVEIMEHNGVMEIVTGGISRVGDFQALQELRTVAPEIRDAPLALTALAGFVHEDIDRLADRFRLSNAERKRMLAAHAAWRAMGAEPGDEAIRRELYRSGRGAAIDGVLLAWSRSEAGPEEEDWHGRLAEARTWQIPAFPLSGRQIITAGLPPGPKVGAELHRLEELWIASGYRLTASDLLAQVIFEA